MLKRKLSRTLLLLAIMFITTLVLTQAAKAEGNAKIWTDKADYDPGQTVTIFGSGFLANANVTITIVAPDSSVATIYAWTNGSGGFTAQHVLAGMEGTFTVTATDGTNTATTTFTDTINRYFTATISPTTATTGETKSYTITITNDMSSSSGVVLGSAKIKVPSGFTSVSITSVSYPSGKTWTATLDSGYIKLKASSSGGELARGQSVSVTFSATAPGTAGTYEWTTSAWVDRSYGSGTAFTIKGSQPKVTVTAPSTVPITITSSPVTGAGFVKVDNNPITTPTTFTWTVGSTHKLEALSPVAGPTGTQYVWTSWSDSGIQTHNYTVPSSSATVTANYKTQYYLNVTSPYATPGGMGWYNASTTAYATLNMGTVNHGNGTRRIFINWNGDASGTNYAQSNPITMNGPKTATANWKTQDYLTVSSAQGTPSGEGWYNASTTAYATITPLTVAGPTGVQYVFTGWSGDASGTGSPSNPITMNGPKTATANWKTQYYLTVVSPYATPSGEDWYDSGSTAYATVSISIVDHGNGTRRVFVNWSGDATGPGITSDPITMSAPKTAIANWKTQDYLTVKTDRSGLSPAPTPSSNWYDKGTYVVLTAPNQSYLGTGKYDFVYWDIDGINSTSNPITVYMNPPHTATAHYQSVPPPIVGGQLAFINKLPLLAPQLGMVLVLLAAMIIMTAGIRRKGKQH